VAEQINVHAAKTHLSELLREVEDRGAEYVICRAGRPVARLVPLAEPPSAPASATGLVVVTGWRHGRAAE
jgi:prevent-host-death family protein